jgi:DNA-directed RNA polymerase subunit L
MEHPQLGNPKLIVRTKGKAPEAAIKSALKKIEKKASDFEALLKKK